MASIENVSPLAPKAGFPKLPAIKGVRFAAAEAGVKYENRKDVMLAVADPGSVIAGVFTTSATRSSNVLDCQAKINGDCKEGLAIIVNSGNSNAFTGRAGDNSVDAICQSVAEEIGITPECVFTSSTGVIGERLPHDRITAKVAELHQGLSEERIEDAADAIMTTDTFSKGAHAMVEGDGGSIKIAGIAKGSGMIAPDMATMLVYLFTDAKMSRRLLQDLVRRATDETFNCITVDSDTSTSDTLLMVATGQSDAASLQGGTTTCDAFYAALKSVMLELAHLVVKDGEGATKFVEVRVTGAKTSSDAKKVASAIANSPLVKTAIAGEDPNWGRVVMAVGKSGAAADRDRLSIYFGDILVAEKGWVAESYTEEAGSAYMKADEITVHADLGLGAKSATMWTCDLTHGYISINADYRS